MRFYVSVYILLSGVVINVSCDCGIATPRDNSSITDRNGTEFDVFPWHVLIYEKVSPGDVALTCAGTLISSNAVISAARCLYDEILSPKINASRYNVVAGKRHRHDGWPGDHCQESGVKFINLDSEFRGFMNYFAKDIALLILERPFNLTSWIKPICIDLDNVQGRVALKSGEIGKAMGCGKKANSYISSKIQHMNLNHIHHDRCIPLVPEFASSFVTVDKFCGSYLNESRFCRSDQGAGLYFQYNGLWYIRGVLSITSFFGRSSVNEHPALFTDVEHIVDEINNSTHARKCGIARRLNNPFVLDGFRVEPGVFPWQVGVYQKNSAGSYVQICAGSLISSNVVVSAAHCFYDDVKKQKIKASEFAVAVGKHDRPWDWPERYLQKSAVKTIHLSSRYTGLDGNYASDIAWLILRNPFTLTSFVTPVCLDSSNWHKAEEHHQVGQVGKVGSWGMTADGSPGDELKEMKLPVISRAECISAFPRDFAPYVTMDKFCAGYLNRGTSLCNGDSGGGLVFNRNGRWYLRGIVSITIRKGDTCDPNYYTAFTNVGYFAHELYEFTNITNFDMI